MKFSLKNTSGENTSTLMRELGYHFWGRKRETDDKETGNKEAGKKEIVEMAFVRPIGELLYPRFHIYLRENKRTSEIFFNLHLDQKKPIYKGVPAHSGEYEGEVVEKFFSISK